LDKLGQKEYFYINKYGIKLLEDTQKIVDIGFHNEVQLFLQRHKLFFEKFTLLQKSLEGVFLRQLQGHSLADTLIFYLGRRCLEDFWDVLILCANGRQQGASSLLRGMFERSVTMKFIREHPDTAEDFFDYGTIDDWKILNIIKENYEISPENEKNTKEIEEKAKLLRPKFEVTNCKNCKTKRLNHTWNKLNLVEMAKRVGYDYSTIIQCYYFPLRQAHSTIASVMTPLKEEEGGFTIKEDLNYPEIDRTLQMSHCLILGVLATQIEQFKLNECIVESLLKDFKMIWKFEDK
jgi:hypothetical protein